MIQRKLSKYIYVHENNKEASFVASQGINLTKAPTIREYIQDICNLDVAENGSLTLRKSIVADTFGTGKALGWNFDDSCYFYVDGSTIHVKDKTIRIKFKDLDDVEHIQSFEDITSVFDFSNAELINTATSSFLTNVLVASPITTDNNSYDIVTRDTSVYRILKVVEYTNTLVTLEIYRPETSYLDSSTESVIVANLASDDAYNITDNYDANAISIEGIIAYAYAHHPHSADPKPTSASMPSGFIEGKTVVELLESLNDDKLTPYTNTVKSNTPTVLKAFMNLSTTELKNIYDPTTSVSPYFCTWEYSYDGIVWLPVPEFVDDSNYSIPSFKAKVIDPTKSEEELESSTETKWYREITARKLLATSNKDAVDSRADILVLSKVDNCQYRFTIYRNDNYDYYVHPKVIVDGSYQTTVKDTNGAYIFEKDFFISYEPYKVNASTNVSKYLIVKLPAVWDTDFINYHKANGDFDDILSKYKAELQYVGHVKREYRVEGDDPSDPYNYTVLAQANFTDDSSRYTSGMVYDEISNMWTIRVDILEKGLDILPYTTVRLYVVLSKLNDEGEYEELYKESQTIFVNFIPTDLGTQQYATFDKVTGSSDPNLGKICIYFGDSEEYTKYSIQYYLNNEAYYNVSHSQYSFEDTDISYSLYNRWAYAENADNGRTFSDSLIDEQTYTGMLSSDYEFLYTKYSYYSNGSNVSKHMYYKYKLYTYGSEVLKNNVLVSDTDSFTTPIMNTIDLYTEGDSKVTALTPWRDYFIAATDNSIHLVIPQSSGFLTKIVNTYIGIPEADRDTLKSILNGIIFKSGNKIYTLNPNAYSSDDTLLSLTEISKPVATYILENTVKSFAFATSDAYYLFMLNDTDDCTYVVKYEFTRMIWNRYILPKRFIDYTLNNIEDIKLYDESGCSYKFNAIYDVDIPNNIVYGDKLFDSNGEVYIQPFKFSLDSGEKTTDLNKTKQYVESKLIVGVANEPDIFPMDVDIYVNGFPAYHKHIDCSSDHSMLQDTYSPPYPTQSINLVNTTITTENARIVGTLRQEFLRYSLKGKTIRHIISGESYSNFNIFVVYYKYKESHVKQ